jgi:hypothetical protein
MGIDVHLLANEKFEGSGLPAGWTEVKDGSNTIDYDAAIVGTPPFGFGNYCMKSIVADATDNDAFIYASTGGDQTSFYVRVYVYVESEGLSDGETVNISSLLNTEGTIFVARIEMGQNSGQLQVRYGRYSSSVTEWTGWVNINTGQWYCFEYSYNTSAETWEWKIDGVSQDNGTLAETHDEVGVIIVGLATHTGSSATTAYSDNYACAQLGFIGRRARRIAKYEEFLNPKSLIAFMFARAVIKNPKLTKREFLQLWNWGKY